MEKIAIILMLVAIAITITTSGVLYRKSSKEQKKVSILTGTALIVGGFGVAGLTYLFTKNLTWGVLLNDIALYIALAMVIIISPIEEMVKKESKNKQTITAKRAAACTITILALLTIGIVAMSGIIELNQVV